MTAKNISRGTKRQRGRRPGEKGVPIDRARLQKALDASVVSSRAELARRLKENQQTINYVFSRASTCEASLLEAISTVLEVPVAYLIQDGELLPLQPSADKSATEVQFVIRCLATYLRDENRCKSEEERAQRKRSTGEFVYAIYELLRPQVWWKHLLVPARDDRPDRDSYWQLLREHDDEPTESDMDHRTAVAIIEALELILEPWFAGLAKLDYEKIVQWAYPSVDGQRKRPER